MKIIVLLFIAMIQIAKVQAYEYRLLQAGASVSMHPMATGYGGSEKFSNKLSNDGMFVLNKPTISFSHVKVKSGKYSKWTWLYSRDCVNSPVYGLVYSMGTYYSPSFYAGWAFGGYFMSDKVWNEREMPRSWISLHNKFTGPHTAFVPILGIELNVRVIKIGAAEINWNTYLNPILINSTIAFGFKF